MFCPKCGSKLSDGAQFCTECGLPLGGLSVNDNETPGTEPTVAPTDNGPAVEPAAAPDNAARSSMVNFFMQKRQIGNRLVPQFAIMIAAFIAAAGIAYAAVMVYKNVVEPNLQQPTQQEQPTEEPKKAEKKEDETKQVNEAAHAAYQDVLEQYREALTNGDYDDYLDEDGIESKSGRVFEYFTDFSSNTKYPLVNGMVASQQGMYGTGVTADNSLYVYVDLNDDGVDELLLSSVPEWSDGHFVYAVYAYIDGEVKGLCGGWERNTYWLCEGKLLLNHGSGGWATNTNSVLKYTSESNFETIDQVNEDWDDETHTVTTVRTKNGQEISRVTEPVDSTEPEAAKLFAAQEADYPEDTSINWQPLS